MPVFTPARSEELDEEAANLVMDESLFNAVWENCVSKMSADDLCQ